jgi:hypothetical protein
MQKTLRCDQCQKAPTVVCGWWARGLGRQEALLCDPCLHELAGAMRGLVAINHAYQRIQPIAALGYFSFWSDALPFGWGVWAQDKPQTNRIANAFIDIGGEG